MTSPDGVRSLRGALSSSIDAALRRGWFAVPGVVESFDGRALRARVRPALDRLVDGAAREQPAILDVPVMYPSGGGALVAFPLSAGDDVLLLFSQRGLTDWKARLSSGRARARSLPDRGVFLRMSDAVALPGFASPSELPNPDDASALAADSPGLRLLGGAGPVVVGGLDDVSGHHSGAEPRYPRYDLTALLDRIAGRLPDNTRDWGAYNAFGRVYLEREVRVLGTASLSADEWHEMQLDLGPAIPFRFDDDTGDPVPAAGLVEHSDLSFNFRVGGREGVRMIGARDVLRVQARYSSRSGIGTNFEGSIRLGYSEFHDGYVARHTDDDKLWVRSEPAAELTIEQYFWVLPRNLENDADDWAGG